MSLLLSGNTSCGWGMSKTGNDFSFMKAVSENTINSMGPMVPFGDYFNILQVCYKRPNDKYFKLINENSKKKIRYVYEITRKGRGVLDLNRDSLILWSGSDENIQQSDSVGLIMNKGLKSFSDNMNQCNLSCGG